MRIYKDTPFEFGLMPWEHKPPETIALIFMKATFDLVPNGTCTIASEQQTISGEVFYDDAENPSVVRESDFALYKARGEYLLRGSARAPHDRPTTLVPVSAKVGPLEKTIAVYGDRHWVRGVLDAKPSDPEPFTAIPLRWERAFGGPEHPDNPSGVGAGVVTPEGIEPLPNLEDPQDPVVSRASAPTPIGFGPIPSTWPQRTALTGTYDERWKRSRWPYLPRDFSFDFFQAAPLDQRLERGFWRGDESIWLRGLHPEQIVAQTVLPGLRTRCFVQWAQRPSGETAQEVEEPTVQVSLGEFHRFMAEQEGASPPAPIEPAPSFELEPDERAPLPVPTLCEIPLALDTISIDADAQQVTCLWRGMLQGVSDARLSNVERLFFLHEELADATRPLRFYELWLHRLLLGEASEDEALEAEGEPEEPETAPPLLTADTSADTPRKAIEGLYAAMAGLLELDRQLVQPTISEVRESFEEQGLEPPEELVEPEIPPVAVEDELPRSALRLAAIIRRKLGRPFAGYDWTAAPFAGLDLSGANLAGALLNDAELTHTNLARADLQGAVLYRARLDRADLREANLSDAELSQADFELSEMQGAVLTDAHGRSVNLRGANLEGVRAEGVELLGSDLSGTCFVGSALDRADLSGSQLDGADFTGASLVDASIEGCSARRTIFERCRATDLRASDGVDFTDATLVLIEAPKAQFQGAIGVRASFSGANLAGADFSEAQLLEANFVRCDLSGACFALADLRLCQLMFANGFETDFDQANLEQADLHSAHLFSANLYRTRLDGAKMAGANLARTYLDRG